MDCFSHENKLWKSKHFSKLKLRQISNEDWTKSKSLPPHTSNYIFSHTTGPQHDQIITSELLNTSDQNPDSPRNEDFLKHKNVWVVPWVTIVGIKNAILVLLVAELPCFISCEKFLFEIPFKSTNQTFTWMFSHK
jgi:hypothetical protein